MKQFILGFVLGIVFVGLVFFVIGAALVLAIGQGSGPGKIADNSVLVLPLSGPVPEQAALEVSIPFLAQSGGMTVLEIYRVLDAAADDDRIEALVLDAGGLSTGWAKMEELRSEIEKFKTNSGKPVYAYLSGATSREYYIASAADRIYMGPQDWLDVKGLRAELMYLKGLLDKIGVEMEFEAFGKYKDAPDQYTKTGPSETTLEVLNETLDQFYGNLVDVIANGRGWTHEQVLELINEGPFVAQNALSKGLVDGLLFKDDFYDEVKNAAGIDEDLDLTRTSASTYLANLNNESPAGKWIAVVTADGEILPSSSQPSFSEVAITSRGMTKILRQIRDDDRISGVILRVDSPGGDAVASDEILHEMQKLSEKKPLVISMSDYAASGGYMISMTGDPVLAYDNTQTGSIGVFFGKPNLKGLFDKLGVNVYTMDRGKWASIDSSVEPMTTAERNKLHGELEVYYQRFVDLVAEGRHSNYETIAPLAEGRVWLGRQAADNDLVDKIGGFDEAIAMVRENAEIPESDKISLIAYPRRQTLWELLLNQEQQNNNMTTSALLSHWAAEWTGAAEPLEQLKGLPWRSLSHGGALELAPYSIEVQ